MNIIRVSFDTCNCCFKTQLVNGEIVVVEALRKCELHNANCNTEAYELALQYNRENPIED